MENTVLWAGLGAVTAVNIICMIIIVIQAQTLKNKKSAAQHYHLDVQSSSVVPEEEMNEMQKEARAKIERAFDGTFVNFDQALGTVAEKVAAAAEEKLQTALEDERAKFEATMSHAASSVSSTAAEVAKRYQAEAEAMLATLETTLAEEKAKRVASFEERMGAIVASYIADSFDSSAADLSTQTELIVKWLEQHKEAIKKDLA